MKIRTLSIATVIALALCAPVQAEPEWPQGLPQPYTASYVLYRNGKLAGRGEMTLQALGGNQYLSTSDTHATRGFAGFLGGKVGERSSWELTDTGPRSLEFVYDQKVAFSKRRRESHFDYQSGQVHGRNKGDDWTLPLRAGAMDRLLANFLLIQDVATGEQRMSYLVAERGRYKEYEFERTGSEQIETPLGVLQTIRVERRHSNPQRQTISWHAPEHAWLPVRIIHVADDGERLRLDIETIEFR